MSVKDHEAFSLDSARRRFHFDDHFLGDSLRDLWRDTGDAGGSATVVDQQDGGICRITTGAVDQDEWWIDWNDIRSLHIDKKVTMETRVRLVSNSSIDVRIYLQFDGNNKMGFYDVGVNYGIVCSNGGASTTTDTGIGTDTSYHVFRIEAFPVGEVHYYIDGVEVTGSPITTNIPSDAGDYLQPYIWLNTDEAVSKSLDIDYVVIRQDR